jgi:hypothetical protein
MAIIKKIIMIEIEKMKSTEGSNLRLKRKFILEAIKAKIRTNNRSILPIDLKCSRAIILSP